MLFARKITTLICLILTAMPALLHAQYSIGQNKAWMFGRNAGISFTSGAPVAVYSEIHAAEGCASLADTAGNLLFYSDGDTVWNRNNVPMPNGSAIVPFSCVSSSQAAVIAHVPGSAAQYYLFSLEHALTDGHLTYSIVDMSLDGGLGDVVASSKAVPIDDGFSEKMLTIPGDCDMWLLVHKTDTTKFYAYKISADGIDTTPVVSIAGDYDNYYGYGVMKVSHDRSKLVLTHYDIHGALSRTELFDFDPSTGIVSNCRILNTYGHPYGAEFSPDNSKLYVHYWIYGKILQYDVSLATTADIIASEYVVASSIGVGSDMRLGPDSMIYFSPDASFFNRINAPDSAGAACHYTTNVIDMAPYRAVIGLPAVYWADTACPSVGIQLPPAHTKGINIYPNPAKDRLTITLPGNGSCDVQILDMIGSLRLNATDLVGAEVNLSVADLPNGNYFVRVSHDGIVYKSAIVIKGR